MPLLLVVAVGLVLAVLGCLAGAVYLVATGNDTPEFLVATGSAALGALAGILAPSPKESGR